jgi:hypothetical protein
MKDILCAFFPFLPKIIIIYLYITLKKNIFSKLKYFFFIIEIKKKINNKIQIFIIVNFLSLN